MVPEHSAVALGDFGGSDRQDTGVRAEQQIDPVLDDQALSGGGRAGGLAAIVVDK